VVIGLRGDGIAGPVIESGVSIGTGAKVLGRVRVGAGARIGANAVVLEDVGPGATAVGVPARPIADGAQDAPSASVARSPEQTQTHREE